MRASRARGFADCAAAKRARASACPAGSAGSGLTWLLLALVIGSRGIAYWEDQRTARTRDIDAAMLSDDLRDAYLDHGFNAYLTRNH